MGGGVGGQQALRHSQRLPCGRAAGQLGLLLEEPARGRCGACSPNAEPARAVPCRHAPLPTHHWLDHVLHQVLLDLVVGHVGVVLGGDEDGVHAQGHHGTALLLVLNGHLPGGWVGGWVSGR